LICALSLFSVAQKKNSQFQFHIQKTTTPVTVDGSDGEPAWQEAETAANFFMVLPMDTSKASVRTDIKMTYDDRSIYIIAICWLPRKGQPYMVESLRRDFNFGRNDNFIFFLDTYKRSYERLYVWS
jgi:hypothetical protein